MIKPRTQEVDTMNEQPDTTESPAERIDRVAKELGLAMTTQFVPWSQSRNKGEKNPSLNWAITIKCNDREILTTDYMAGAGHCHSFKASVKKLGGANCIMRAAVLNWECEHGYQARYMESANCFQGVSVTGRGNPILPELRDVLYSLASDSDVLDSSSFEDWAANYDYDTDSRQAEATYRACLDIALKLRNALGEDGLRRLREACQDY